MRLPRTHFLNGGRSLSATSTGAPAAMRGGQALRMARAASEEASPLCSMPSHSPEMSKLTSSPSHAASGLWRLGEAGPGVSCLPWYHSLEREVSIGQFDFSYICVCQLAYVYVGVRTQAAHDWTLMLYDDTDHKRGTDYMRSVLAALLLFERAPVSAWQKLRQHLDTASRQPELLTTLVLMSAAKAAIAASSALGIS